MKKIYILLALGFIGISCSSDDDSSNNNNSDATANYFPMEQGKYWVYNTPGSIENGRDSLYVSNDTVISGNTYTKFRTGNLPYGFYTGTLNNNGVRKSGSKLLVSGSSALSISEEFPLGITINDFVMFDAAASNNTVLDNVEGVLQQNIEGFDIDFDYGLTSRNVESLDSYTVNNQLYTNVKVVETTLALKISSDTGIQGFPPIVIMPLQNILVSRQYYAENIGVIHVVTDIEYELAADFSGLDIELPIPQSGAEHQEEILIQYNAE